jgi:hypothetical protein
MEKRKAREKEAARKTKTYVGGQYQDGSCRGGMGDVDWIGLPLDRSRWRALVNVAMNLRDP